MWTVAGSRYFRKHAEVARGRTAHLSNVEFHLLTRTSLSMFPDHSFDKAYSVAVLIHLDKEDFFLYLRELARVLRPGGLLYFDVWNLAHEVGWRRWLMEVEHWATSDQSQRKDVARNQFCAPEEVRLYVQRAGLAELFCLTDSPWVQMIAAKLGTGVDLNALRGNRCESISFPSRSLPSGVACLAPCLKCSLVDKRQETSGENCVTSMRRERLRRIAATFEHCGKHASRSGGRSLKNKFPLCFRGLWSPIVICCGRWYPRPDGAVCWNKHRRAVEPAPAADSVGAYTFVFSSIYQVRLPEAEGVGFIPFCFLWTVAMDGVSGGEPAVGHRHCGQRSSHEKGAVPF